MTITYHTGTAEFGEPGYTQNRKMTIELPGQTFWGSYATRDGTEVKVKPRVGGGAFGEGPHDHESWDAMGNNWDRNLDLMRAVKPKERY